MFALLCTTVTWHSVYTLGCICIYIIVARIGRDNWLHGAQIYTLPLGRPWHHHADLVLVSADPDYTRGGGQGEDGVRDDEASAGPWDAAEHHPEEPARAGEHAEWDGRAPGQDQQDVRYARQVQGRPHAPTQ